ncbi:MarR family winged helix-turn-helix transcriptional regulator [Naasia sp. SYSU D00057]|uniref:MarR family winged helix-turn-helix transcriptional regulator n=1 Tax=Naasia sp. SYSU D00057 TaxID=2817380 RepID=UPI0027DC07B3|nr:MarR family winged helix-turn-helix transcriptional regulator [Naasia sp. SYSU D00057]
MGTAVDTWESLFRAQVAVMRRLVADFPRGMSFNEYDVLFNLTRLPGRQARMRDLNGVVLLSQPSISRLVDRLVARGLLERLPDPTDRRGTVVHVTDEGFRTFRRIAGEHSRSIERTVGAALPEEELAELRRLTDALRAGLGSEPTGQRED